MYFCDLTPSAWNKPRTSVWQVGQMSNKVGCALIEYWTPFVRFPLLNSRFIQNIWIRSQYWAELLLCPSLKGHFFRTVSEQESAFHKSTSPASWPAGACYLYSLVLWQKFFGNFRFPFHTSGVQALDDQTLLFLKTSLMLLFGCLALESPNSEERALLKTKTIIWI